MTLEELLARESIRDTMARYNMAGDRLKLQDFIAVFTEDAVLESVNVAAQDSFCYRGKAAIHEWMSRWSQRSSDQQTRTHQATFVRHHLSTSVIELTGTNTARAKTYWVAYTDIGPDHAGHYLDEFRKTGDDWLISHRRVRLDWRSTESLFTTAITRSR